MEAEYIIIIYNETIRYKIKESKMEATVDNILASGLLIKYIFPVEADVKKEYGIT